MATAQRVPGITTGDRPHYFFFRYSNIPGQGVISTLLTLVANSQKVVA